MFTEPCLANVTIFAGNFAPRSWMFCHGQLLSIAEYSALYALIGTLYGGDGQSTFALPDLRSRVAIHPGQGPGLSPYMLGQVGGQESVTLNGNHLPMHSHALTGISGSPGASSAAGNTDDPTGNVPAATAGINSYNTAGTGKMAPISAAAISPAFAGGGQPVPTVSPVLAMNYIIAVEGIFPSRN